MSPSTASHPTPRSAPEGSTRHEVLRHALLDTVDHLQCRRAHLIDEEFIDNYVALGWLEWHGGQLRVSALGSVVCEQMSARLSPLDS